MILEFPKLWGLVYHFSNWLQEVSHWLLIDGEPNPFHVWHFLILGSIIFSIGFIGFLIGRKTK